MRKEPKSIKGNGRVRCALVNGKGEMEKDHIGTRGELTEGEHKVSTLHSQHNEKSISKLSKVFDF